MNSVLLLIGLSFLSLFSKAQSPKDFIGKWKAVAANNGVYYDYKKDSAYITEKFAKTLIEDKDSAETVGMFTSFVSQFADYYFIFDEQGKYQEIRDGEVRLEGTYKINKNEKKITVSFKKADKDGTINFGFESIKEGMKFLFVPGIFKDDILEIFVEKTR